MIKQRLKRLTSVVAAAAIAISTLCAPIEAAVNTYQYFINLDENGNIQSGYSRDSAQVDLATSMDPLEFIQAGETYNTLPTVYPWEELSVAVWRGDSEGNGVLDREQLLVNGKIAESTMDINTFSYGRYIQVSKSGKPWSMTIPCKDLNGDSLDDVTISWDADGEASVDGLDFNNNIRYILYRNKGNVLDYVSIFFNSEALLSCIKNSYDATDPEWKDSFSIESGEIKEVSITASPLTYGKSCNDITFSLSTDPNYDQAKLNYTALLDEGVSVVPDVAPNVSMICGSMYKLYVGIQLGGLYLPSDTKVKFNNIELEEKSTFLDGSQGYWEVGSGSYNLWYTFAVDHDVTPQKGVPATCTEDGYKDYYKCASCGQLFSDKDDRTATIGSSVDSALIIPATGHNATKHNAKPSTCTDRGNIEYWQCNNEGCGKYFLTKADVDNDNSTSWAYITVAPAHTYTNAQYPNGKYKSRNNTYHNRVCLICDFVDIEVGESHTFSGNSCTKCGYEKSVVTTTSAAGTNPVTTTSNISTTTTAPTTSTTTVPTTTPYHYVGSRPYFTTPRVVTTSATTTTTVTTTTAITTTTTAATTTTTDDTSTPPDDKSKEPFLKGRNGLYGWSAIRDEIAKAKKGDRIYVDMNGTTKLPKNILEALEDKDVTLVLDMDDDFSWEINGKDVYEPRDLDLGVSKGAGIPIKVINALTGECTYILITLEYDGEFGCKATLVADMGADNSGYWANLYWYVDDDEFEFITSGVIGEDGEVRLEFTHASEYAIVLDDHDHGAKNADEDDNPHTGVSLSLGAVTIAAAAVIAAKKRRK